MTDVLIAGVLGAAVLAIVLLHRSNRKHAEMINQLRAEITAAKIAALQQRTIPAPAGDEPEPEPVRRRRHLALYIGGGVAAVLASLGDRLRPLWQRHRAATAAGTAVAVAAASTAAALYLTLNDHPSDAGGHHPRAAAPGTPGSSSGDRGKRYAPHDEPSDGNARNGGRRDGGRAPGTERTPGPADDRPSPTGRLSPQAATRSPEPGPRDSASSSMTENRPGPLSPPVTTAPPADPEPSTPNAGSPVPETPSTNPPDAGDGHDGDGDCLIRVHLGELVDLCV
ncbi:hypothetical protein ACFOOM_01295 [Streptomyces echinoruber]|nr:hypothetical protein [Streptomyces echinoruber]